MKRLFLAAVLATAAIATPALAGDVDVGVSISIGQPGFYGRIDIGDAPRPQVLYRQPVIIERVPVHRPPIYLNVPPGHAKHWRKHCHRYDACGERVYFVQNRWYEREYVPHYQKRHGKKRFDDDRHDGRRDERRDDRRDDERRWDDRGRGR